MTKFRDILLAIIGLIALFAGTFAAWMFISMMVAEKRAFGEFIRGTSEFLIAAPLFLCVIFSGGFTAVYFFKRAFDARSPEMMER